MSCRWFVLFILPCISACVWQQRWDFQTASWQDESFVVEMHAGYEERRSLDPTAGTTRKRNFQTRLQTVSTLDKKPRSISRPVPGQALEDLYFINNAYYFIATPDPAGPERALVRISPDLQNASILPAKGLQRLLPSPDRKRVALLSGETGAYAVRIAASETIEQAVRDADDRALTPQGEVQWSWSADSHQLFVYAGGEIVSFDGVRSARAARFPKCFRPSTKWGGRIGDHGVLYERDSLEAEPRMVRVAGWLSHASIPLISEIGEVGAGCP